MKNLATYLNDHLAGSVAAVELLEHLKAAHKDNDVGRFASELLSEIEADRVTLKTLMERLDVDQSVTRKVSGWVAGKLTEIKLRLEDPSGDSFLLFETYEALSLGIEGKRSLWITLAAVADVESTLRLFDYEGLAQRAQDQRDRVEDRRLETATSVLRQGEEG